MPNLPLCLVCDIVPYPQRFDPYLIAFLCKINYYFFLAEASKATSAESIDTVQMSCLQLKHTTL
jgi:hypothetical protein